jgi:hypothetical protein
MKTPELCLIFPTSRGTAGRRLAVALAEMRAMSAEYAAHRLPDGPTLAATIASPDGLSTIR